jgi:hypothetical protein
MTHAWCFDPSRDEAVRAAEDGRDRPLPTLGAVIAQPFANKVKWSPTVSKTGQGQSGLRTERVVLEVTHDSHLSLCDWPSLRTFFGESVRVVEEEDGSKWDTERHHYEGHIAALKEERDEAIRDLRSVTAERAKLDEQLESVACRAATAETALESAPAASGGGDAWHCAITSPPPIGEFKLCRWVTTVCGNRQVSYGEGARRADGMWGRSSRVETIPPEQWQDLPAGPSASRERWESQAASGGGEVVVDAWGVVQNGSVESVAHRRFRQDAEGIAERWGCPVVPLYRSPPQPRGWLTQEEREIIAGIADDDEYTEEGQNIAKGLLARSSPPEVVLEERDWYDGSGRRVGAFDPAKTRAALAAAGVAVKEVG